MRAARRPQARPPYGAPQVSSPGPPVAVSERRYGPCGVSGCPFVLFGVKQPVLGSQTTDRRGPGPAAPPQAQGGPVGPSRVAPSPPAPPSALVGTLRDVIDRNHPKPPQNHPKTPRDHHFWAQALASHEVCPYEFIYCFLMLQGQ